MATTVDTSQNLPLSLVTTLAGVPVPAGAIPVWSSDNEALAKVGVIDTDPTGTTAMLVTVAPGTVSILATLGSLTATLVVTITGSASNAPDMIMIVAGDPIAKVADAPPPPPVDTPPVDTPPADVPPSDPTDASAPSARKSRAS